MYNNNSQDLRASGLRPRQISNRTGTQVTLDHPHMLKIGGWCGHRDPGSNPAARIPVLRTGCTPNPRRTNREIWEFDPRADRDRKGPPPLRGFGSPHLKHASLDAKTLAWGSSQRGRDPDGGFLNGGGSPDQALFEGRQGTTVATFL